MRFESYLRQIGRNIREARVRCGFKQTDVNAGAGLSYRHYQNIEAGRVNVTVETLFRLSQLFNVGVEELVRRG
jgi:transcriptional regulator with XRE-family HTH domain